MFFFSIQQPTKSSKPIKKIIQTRKETIIPSRYIGKDGHGHAGMDTWAPTRGHGQTDTDRRHDAKDVQLWKTDRYGKGRQLWKTGIYGKDRKKVFKSEIFSRETHTVHNQYYTYCK